MVQMFGETWQWVVLGADAVVLYFLHKWYRDKILCAEEIENTPNYDLNADLKKLLEEQPENSLPYVCIEGTTQALDKPLTSHFNNTEQGVLQKILFVEHKSKRSNGYWSDVKKVIKDQVNTRPFAIAGASTPGSPPILVEVGEPLMADFLTDSLTITYDHYEPNTDTLLSRGLDRLFGEISKGYQETEKMLTVGVKLLGIGQLVLNKDKIHLEPSLDLNKPYILTTLGKKQVVKELEKDARTLKIFRWVVGLCGAGLFGYLLYKNVKLWAEYIKVNRMYKEIRGQRAKQEQERLARRSDASPGENGEPSNCVICLQNPREIVILECGHICICADCARILPEPRKCPICRGSVTRFVSTYVS